MQVATNKTHSSDASSFDNVDIMAYVQWVLRDSYLQTVENLKTYAEKVKFYSEVKKRIREELKNARDLQAKNSPCPDENKGNPSSLANGGPLIPNVADTNFTGSSNVRYMNDPLPAPDRKAPAEDDTRTASPGEKDPGGLIALARQYEIDRAKPHSVPVPEFPLPDRTNTKDRYGVGYGERLAAWYRELPAEQQEAVKAYLKEHGLSYHIWVEESDTFSTGENATVDCGMRRLNAGEDPEKYFLDLGNKLEGALPSEIDGSSTADAWKINFKDEPSRTVDIPLPMPPELEAAGYIPGAGFPPGSASAIAGGPTAPPGARRQGGSDGREWKSGQRVDTYAQLESYIKALEDKLNTVGDDAQLANVDLQNVVQCMQQELQKMANLSKSNHDTICAIIRKIE